jgi:hypothetical protein
MSEWYSIINVRLVPSGTLCLLLDTTIEKSYIYKSVFFKKRLIDQKTKSVDFFIAHQKNFVGGINVKYIPEYTGDRMCTINFEIQEDEGIFTDDIPIDVKRPVLSKRALFHFRQFSSKSYIADWFLKMKLRNKYSQIDGVLGTACWFKFGINHTVQQLTKKHGMQATELGCILTTEKKSSWNSW